MKFARITAGLCAGVLAFGVTGWLPVQDFSLTASAAESGTLGDNLTWTLDDAGLLTISGEGEWQEEQYLPDEIKESVISVVIENGVTSIGHGAFFKCENLTSVTIPESVASIQGNAFDNCRSLTSITIPDSVITIGTYAFHMSGLREITIPASVTSLGESEEDTVCALLDCPYLTAINVSPDNQIYCSLDGVLFNKEMTELIQYPPNYTERAYIIPDGVTSIADSAFVGSNLMLIVIPDSVTSIGDSAFEGCTGLTYITIPDSVTTIGAYAFSFSGLREITIPASVTNLGESEDTDCALCDCYHLTAINVSPDNQIYSSLDGVLFNKEMTELIQYPLGCTNQAYTIPDGVTSIRRGGFFGCYSLTDITIPESVISIGYAAFQGCSNLTSITISDGVTSIDESAFAYCDGLTSITIPESVTSIGNLTFENCKSLTSITILNPLCEIFDAESVVSNELGVYNGVIRGYAGSTAQAYAENWGYTFESIGGALISEPAPDMDGDGKITATDAQAVLIAFSALLTDEETGLTPEQLAAADVDGNGEITALDAQYILTYYLYNTVMDEPTTWDEILHPDGK